MKKPLVPYDLGLLFLLGAGVSLVCTWLFSARAQPLAIALSPLAALAVVAGAMEARSFARSGRRRWLWPWLAPALGLAAEHVARNALWELRHGPGGVDVGMARGIELVVLLVLVLALAAAVSIVAALLVRLSAVRARRARGHPAG